MLPTWAAADAPALCGQVGADGEYVLLDSGPLPEAVAASAAIPFVFENVAVPGRYLGYHVHAGDPRVR